MSGVSFSFNKIRGFAATIKHVSEESVEAAADVAKDYAQSHVQVKTGETRDSIHTEVEGESVHLIASGAALFLEYGTIHMRAFPFMRPAMDEAERLMGPEHLKEEFESEA